MLFEEAIKEQHDHREVTAEPFVKLSHASVIPGQKATGLFSTMTPNTFGLIVLVFGGLLLWMAFGHRNVGD